MQYNQLDNGWGKGQRQRCCEYSSGLKSLDCDVFLGFHDASFIFDGHRLAALHGLKYRPDVLNKPFDLLDNSIRTAYLPVITL
ncbi:MAG: hypothetical protein JWL63_708 [Rhodocyclales bacterium]|nr:hypothetical protein [Rhodocyclales bacterium]